MSRNAEFSQGGEKDGVPSVDDILDSLKPVEDADRRRSLEEEIEADLDREMAGQSFASEQEAKAHRNILRVFHPLNRYRPVSEPEHWRRDRRDGREIIKDIAPRRVGTFPHEDALARLAPDISSDPWLLHPHVDRTSPHVGLVPTRMLIGMRGNYTVDGFSGRHSQDTVSAIREDLRAGVGIKSPLTVEYFGQDGSARVGEGNHRLTAAALEGISHVPVQVWAYKNWAGRDGATQRFPGRSLRRISLPYTQQMIHPREVFPEGTVL